MTNINMGGIINGKQRYINLDQERLHTLLNVQNAAYVTKLSLEELELVRNLKKLMITSRDLPIEEFSTKLYALSADPNASKGENRKKQFRFFQIIYQLLLGKDSGPRLAQFILEVDTHQAYKLLDV